MPSIGDTCRADKLGLKGHSTMTYGVCSKCGTERWSRSNASLLCPKCAHEGKPAFGLVAKRASELGYHIRSKDYWLYQDTCPTCKSEVWRRKDAIGKECQPCAQQSIIRHIGPEHPRWAGGRRLRKDGYVSVVLQPDDPMFVMAHPRTHEVLEHRLILARAVGRPLKPWEISHHRNHVRHDNRIENLELISAQHLHQSIGIEDQIQRRLSQLEATVLDLSVQLSVQQALLEAGEHGNPELSVSSDKESG